MTTTAYDKWLDDLADQDVKELREGVARARCPAHNGFSNTSFQLTRIDGSVLIHCFGGCTNDDVLAALGKTRSDYYDDPRGVTYRYCDGRTVHRTPDKRFPQKNAKGATALFHVERLTADDSVVVVVEGEQDVLACESVGAKAVSSAQGASNAHHADWKPLAGRHIILVPDLDEAGAKYEQEVRRQLIGVAASINVATAAVGNDLADHVAAGLTLGQLVPRSSPSPPPPPPEPEPLTRKVSVPPFPVDAFPEPIANMVLAVAEATQTDPAMAGVSALSALSACTGGHARIKIRSGWEEPLCLYTVIVAAPGERKSAVQQATMRPILEVEERLAAKGRVATLEAETRRAVAVKAAEKERNIAASAEKAEQGKALADAIGAATYAEDIKVPPIPRIIADDATPEATASLMVEQGGHIAIISAEAGVFDMIGGRYSKSSVPNMDVYLKGHSGDPLRVDRKGRPPEYIPSPAMTLALMVQLSVLASIAGNRDFRGRGLLARFLYSLPVSKVGHRKVGAAPVTPPIEKAYGDVIANLAMGMFDRRGDDLVILTLTETSHKAMTLIEEAIEPTLAGDGELAALADWGAKFCGAVARIAGMLHLAEHGAAEGSRLPVTADTIRAASRIGTYFRAAAINAFVQMGADDSTTAAVYLLDRMRSLGCAEVSERDLLRAGRRFGTRADMMPALKRLVEHGYLIPLPDSPPIAGRPGSPRYQVHDDVTERTERTEVPDE